VPEILIKLEGAWTGGHAEYLGVRAANVQIHGSGRSTWICVPNHPSLRAKIQKRDGCDIRKHETEWFLDLDASLTYGEKVIVVQQERPGDFVLLGPDVLHWVRASGRAVCAAWNFVLGRAKEMDTYFRNLKAADSNWPNIVPLYWYAQEYIVHKQGGGAIEPECRTLLARELVDYYTKEWGALLTGTDIVWNGKPAPPESFPAFCGGKGCRGEIIDLSFYGLCVSCALSAKDRRKVVYLFPKEFILDGLRQALGDDPKLAALTVLSGKIKRMP
jgi:hypothetical protein